MIMEIHDAFVDSMVSSRILGESFIIVFFEPDAS